MNQQYDNELRGVLFKNNKRTHEKQPEYTGSTQVNGQEFWLSAWVKESKNGQKFFSLSLTPKEPVEESPPQLPAVDVNADIPF